MATRSRYWFVSEPRGHLYEALIEFAGRDCAKAMLVVRPDLGLSPDGKAVLDRLAPHVVAHYAASRWPGTELLDDSTAEVFEYELGPEVARRLAAEVDGLYEWRQPERPEDLAFLTRGGDEYLVSIAHEREGFLSLSDSEWARLRNEYEELASNLERD